VKLRENVPPASSVKGDIVPRNLAVQNPFQCATALNDEIWPEFRRRSFAFDFGLADRPV
jgi:hypothetical protein